MPRRREYFHHFCVNTICRTHLMHVSEGYSSAYFETKHVLPKMKSVMKVRRLKIKLLWLYKHTAWEGKYATASNWKAKHKGSLPCTCRQNSSTWVTHALFMELLTCSERRLAGQNTKHCCLWTSMYYHFLSRNSDIKVLHHRPLGTGKFYFKSLCRKGE
jgi:hypothetical protein